MAGEERPAEADSLDPERQRLRNYRYVGAGSPALQPVEIFDNGSHTFLKFAENQTFPAIFAVGADGETLVNRIYPLDRRYERLQAKLKSLGARIERRASPA